MALVDDRVNTDIPVDAAARLREATARHLDAVSRAAAQPLVETWKLAFARAFVQAVAQSCAGELTEAVRTALHDGPEALAAARTQAERACQELATLDEDLAAAEWAVRCWRLRLRCLQHLEAVFAASRST